ATSSCTTRPFRATGSGRSRKARQWSSRSLTVPKARRPATLPRSRFPSLMAGGAPLPAIGPHLIPHPSSLVGHTLPPPRGQPTLSLFYASWDPAPGPAGLPQLRHLRLDQIGELVERHRVVADLAARLGERLVEIGQLVDLAHRIAECGDVQNPVGRTPSRHLPR